MNRIQSKGREIGTCEVNKIVFFCFDDKIYIQKNGYCGLALGYFSEKFSCQAFCFKFSLVRAAYLENIMF